MAKHFFKNEEYDLARALFEKAEDNIYIQDIGPFGGKTGRVISFDAADININEDEFGKAEDMCLPVVFNRDVGQGTCNAIEWDGCIGDLYCDEDEYQKFVVKSLEKITKAIGDSPIPLNIVIEHLKNFIA